MRSHAVVLGAGGFIGKHLVGALLDAGEQVMAVSRTPLQKAHPQLRIVHAPTASELGEIIRGSHIVYHLASRSTPGSSAGRPLDEISNLELTLAVVDALQINSSTRLVYFSSGGTLYTSGQAAAGEHESIAPRSYHGAGKVAAEAFVRAWTQQFEASATIIRPSNVYGPGQPPRTGFGVIPNAFAHMRAGTTLDVWGDGSQVRDYLYIDDLIDLSIRIGHSDSDAGLRVFNASSGQGTTLNELFAAMEKVSGMPLNRHYDHLRAVDASRVIIDSSKAEHAFGWRASTSLEAGLDATWRWICTDAA